MCGIWGGYCADPDELLRISLDGYEAMLSRGQQGFGLVFLVPEWRRVDRHHYVPDPTLDTVDQQTKEKEVWKDVKGTIRKYRPSLLMGATRYTTDAHSSLEQVLKNPHAAKAKAYANTQPIFIEFRNEEGLLDIGVGGENGNCPDAGKQDLEDRILKKSNHAADVDIRLMTEYFMQLLRETGDNIKAAEEFVESVFGAYAFMYSDGKNGITLFQDRNGVKPLFFGKDIRRSKRSILFGSETELFNRLQYVELMMEAEPGWAYHITQDGEFFKHKLKVSRVRKIPCPFEWEYTEKTNTLVTGMDKTNAFWRFQKGELLGVKYHDELGNVDYVAGVARSGRGTGYGVAHSLRKPYLPVIEKFNRVRNFLVDSEYGFKDGGSADHKWTVERKDIEGYDILLTEDSVIRGRTLAKLLIRIMSFNPKMVRVMVSWPATLFGCDKGNDTLDEQLIANRLIKDGIYTRDKDGFYRVDDTVKREYTMGLVSQGIITEDKAYDASAEVTNFYMTRYLKTGIENAILKINETRMKEGLNLYSTDSTVGDTVFLDLEKLKFYFGEVSDLETMCGKDICTYCLTGKDLPGWTEKKEEYLKAQSLL